MGKAPIAPEITDVILQQSQTNDNRFTSNSFKSTVVGSEESPTAPTLMTAEVEGALSIEASTEPIATNSYASSNETEVALTLDGTYNLGDPFVEDDIVLANTSYTPETDLIDSVVELNAWNQTETWSSAPTSGTNYPGYGWGNAFNGNDLDGASGSATSTATINLSGFALDDPAGIIIGIQQTPIDSDLRVISVNGVTLTSSNTTNLGADAGGTYRYRTSATSLDEVTTNGYITIKYFEVNGQKLIDPGISGNTKIGEVITLPTEKDIKLFQG